MTKLFILLLLFTYVKLNLFGNEQFTTGFIHVGKGEQPTELFYTLFKSRDQNPNAPLVWFFEGGPGMSSLHAMFYQNGPFKLENDGTTLLKNEFSFNNFADVLYLDQPLGTGFSNCSNSSLIPQHESLIIEDLMSFVHNFIEMHPEYTDRPLYMVSQAYGSHFLLPLAKTLLNNRIRHVNLKGIALGNPWIRPELQLSSLPAFSKNLNLTTEFKYVASLYGFVLASVFIDFDLDMQAYDIMNMAFGILIGVNHHAFNRYDYRIRCQTGPCIYNWSKLEKFANSPELKQTLNVGNRHFNLSSYEIPLRLIKHNEYLSDKSHILIELLDNYTIPIYIFSGADDWMINTFGLDQMMDSLHWSGREELRGAFWREWWSNGHLRGTYKKVKNLIYAHVKESGHYVAMDQPTFALDMLSRLTYGA